MKYFYENEKNDQVGPVDIEKLKLSNIKSSSLIWKEGMEDWSEAKNFEELKELFVKPPPLPNNGNTIHINKEISKKNIKTKEPSIWSSKGRLRRSNYFGYSLLLGLIFFAITKTTESFNEDSLINLIFLLILPILYLYIVIIIKRLHDMNFNGWFFFIGFIPVISLILLFWDGIEGPNKYGVDPKGRKSRKKKKK